jgi:Fe-S-cluster containining protein
MEVNKIKSINMDLSKLVLVNPEFSTDPINLDISKPVLTYSNGDKFKIVPLDIMIRQPLIYDKYYDNTSEDDKNVISDITITFCPFSKTAVIYFGLFEMTNKIYNNNIILCSKIYPTLLITQLDGRAYSSDNYSQSLEFSVRKGEAKIMSLRNAITTLPDCSFFKSTKNILDIYPVKELTDFQSVYGIEYISSNVINTSNVEKTAIIIPKTKTGWDIQKNGFKKYMDTMIDKIREKGGMLIPTTEKTWLLFHPDSKKIEL